MILNHITSSLGKIFRDIMIRMLSAIQDYLLNNKNDWIESKL